MAAVALVIQVGPYVRDMSTAWGNPGSTKSFWQPSRRLPARPPVRHQYRVEVVANWGHWEALYVPEAGFYIARGWYQAGRPAGERGALRQLGMTPGASTASWLRSVGVRYVLLPRGPLDNSARAEARLLRSGRSGLKRVSGVGNVDIYRLPNATPIVTGPGARGSISLAAGGVTFTTTEAGTYLVRVRYTSGWSAGTFVTTAESSDKMTLVTVTRPGRVRLHVDPPLS